MSRIIETKPIPARDGLAGDLQRLKSSTDSFLIEINKKASVYATASRLSIPIITRVESDGLRVWRNFKKSIKTIVIENVGTVDKHGEIVEELPEQFSDVSMNPAMAKMLAKITPTETVEVEPVDNWIYLEKSTYNEQTGKDDYFRKKPKGQYVWYKSETHWD